MYVGVRPPRQRNEGRGERREATGEFDAVVRGAVEGMEHPIVGSRVSYIS